jgi:osmoprotectant transport system permease protein
MYPAAAAGEVDVVSAYTSDGRIAQYDLVVLEDPKQAIPPYDAILLVSPKRASDQAFLAALRPLVGAIDVGRMREANRRVSTGTTPKAAARWLENKVGERTGR